MSITTDLMGYLEANNPGDVSFALNQAMPDEKAPIVEVTMQSNRRTRTTKQTSSTEITEFEVECWERNTVAAGQLSDDLIELLEDYRGAMGASNVMATRITNEYQGSDGAAELYHSTFTVTFTHQ